MIKTPCKPFLFDHCIYAIHLRDKGFFNSDYSHRSIYDIFKLDCKNSLTIENIKKDILIKHFFLTIAKFKIFDIPITSSFLSPYSDKLFRFFANQSFKFLAYSQKIIQKNFKLI